MLAKALPEILSCLEKCLKELDMLVKFSGIGLRESYFKIDLKETDGGFIGGSEITVDLTEYTLKVFGHFDQDENSEDFFCPYDVRFEDKKLP